MTDTTVAEIVTFHLNAGTDPDHFAKAAAQMTPFLHRTGAVISRTLSRDETGGWVDHITWTSMTAAKDAASAIMAAPEAAPFMKMIDAQSVNLRHADIHFSWAPEDHAPH